MIHIKHWAQTSSGYLSLPPDTTVPWWHGRHLHFEFS
jgi:hypothetical protein